jgi:elongation factor G
MTQPVMKVNYRYVKQSGGKGQYGHVVFNMEPLDRGNGVVFENKIFGGSIPTEYIPAVQKGVTEAAESGILGGYPVTDVKVTLIDGSFHEVDSNEMAFKMAAILGFKEGMQRGSPVLLEPIMKVEVVVPAEYLGDVLGQLSARRGEIQGMEVRPGNAQAAKAMVPLAEMSGYATEVRSVTQGRGVFSMEFDHYAPVSQSVATKILNP